LYQQLHSPYSDAPNSTYITELNRGLPFSVTDVIIASITSSVGFHVFVDTFNNIFVDGKYLELDAVVDIDLVSYFNNDINYVKNSTFYIYCSSQYDAINNKYRPKFIVEKAIGNNLPISRYNKLFVGYVRTDDFGVSDSKFFKSTRVYNTLYTQKLSIGYDTESDLGNSNIIDYANSSLSVNGSLSTRITTVVSTYDVLPDDYTILVDTRTRAVTVRLPKASSCKGRIYHIKKKSMDANAVTITSIGGSIDGSSSFTITNYGGSITVQSDGADWWII
jgi:hypothetical protein